MQGKGPEQVEDGQEEQKQEQKQDHVGSAGRGWVVIEDPQVAQELVAGGCNKVQLKEQVTEALVQKLGPIQQEVGQYTPALAPPDVSGEQAAGRRWPS